MDNKNMDNTKRPDKRTDANPNRKDKTEFGTDYEMDDKKKPTK